ncbi:MAG: hypothetical protein ABI665_16305 [Vicinamibacterales bacterium]
MTTTASVRPLIVLLFYVALTIALAYPVSVHPSTLVFVDNPDTHLYLWTLAWDTHAFTSRLDKFFDANIYYPFANTLAYSENLIGAAFFAAPVIWLTGNVVLAMNVVSLASCVLCGFGAYLLARRVRLSHLGAVLAGVVFLAAPPRFFRIGQLHLTTVHWVPFALAFYHAYLDGGRKRDLRLAVLFFTLQVLTSGHGAVFLLVSMLALTVYRVACGERIAFVHRLRELGVTGVLLLAPIAFVLAPYRAAQNEMGLKRSLENWLPTPASYLATPSHLHQYLRGLITGTNFNDAANAWLFPGVLTIVLAAIALVPLRRSLDPALPLRARLRHNAVLFYALLVVVSLVLFLPPPVGVWPYVYWLPGFNFIRVPSRFMILAMLALGVLAGAGFDRLSGRVGAIARGAAFAVVCAVLIAEYASMPLGSVPYAITIPAIDRWLDTVPKSFAIAEVPEPNRRDNGAYERHQTTSMLHAMAHWQKTIHGYSGIRPPLHERLYLEMTQFPDEVSVASLRNLGVTFVVVHTEMYPAGEWPKVEAKLANFPGLRLEHVEGEGRVYTILR